MAGILSLSVFLDAHTENSSVVEGVQIDIMSGSSVKDTGNGARRDGAGE